MAPLLFALALLAQDAPAAEAPADGPVATQTARKQDVAPLPIQGGPVSAPTDDFGYVNWCYGAVSGYVDLYDRAMPEVIRIERAWPTPSTEENINEVYPGQKAESLASIELFKRAIAAAEKASPTPIHEQGLAAAKKGRAIWTGATSVPKAQLAQFWMSWSPPTRCVSVATDLETRSNLFGQALTANDGVVAPTVAAKVETPTEASAPVEDAPQVAAVEGEAVADAVEPAVEDAAAPAEASAAAIDDAGGPAEEAAGGSAIEDLLPVDTSTEEAVPAADAEPVADPAPAPAEPTKAPAKKPTRKPGLRETLTGLRGPE